MTLWLSDNLIGILGIIIGAFIAYHVFFLSQRLSSKAKLEHKEAIKQKVEELIAKIRREGLNSEVYLVNINRYFKDYPLNTDKLFGGYSHIKAEIKSTRFDGVQFFCSMPEQVYQKADGRLSFKGSESEKAFITFPVGIVPYEWIEYVDLHGDEHGYVPLFFCRFKGRIYWKHLWRRLFFSGYPYKEVVHYRESSVYRAGSDPVDMKYSFINETISKL